MKKLLLILLILVLLSGCINTKKCEEAAKIDYDMKNPRCTYCNVFESCECSCYEYICKEKSCEKESLFGESFYLK